MLVISEILSNHCQICATAFPRGYKDKKDKRDLVGLVELLFHHSQAAGEP